MTRLLVIVCLEALVMPAAAQHQTYQGQQDRDVKALSAEELAQYRAGAGVGFAKAAELNHYPGPMHVLEFADKLGLSEQQRVATQQLMDAHKKDARAIGTKLVESERRLDALFRSGKVEAGALAKAVNEAAALQGKYRLSHLETHRRMRALLTDQQVARYDELRGYSKPASEKAHRH